MALDHSIVGVPGDPQERSWTSTDALLYAVGVGAGLGDPLRELQFTTENTEGIPQQVLPTFAVLVAQARPGRSLGSFDRAMLVHAEQAFELHQPLPGPRSPPNPPSPRMKTPLRDVTSLAPVATSVATLSLVTSAPEILS